MKIMLHGCFTLLLVFVHVPTLLATFQGQLSIQPPHSSYSSDGKRLIENWDVGGDTQIFSNFLRLTDDRAHKRGWAWSEHPVEFDRWSTTLKFRVSGQGDRLFGDGFALWFTQDPVMRSGKLHGFAEQFKGFGVIFDTFVNKEATNHKDIALVKNDGQKALEVKHGGVIPEDSVGCDANFRFHEKRDDFSVDSHSLIHLKFDKNRVSLYFDAKGLGFWETCFEDTELPFDADWHKQGHLGLTATTGQLADNHDIIALMVSDDPNERYEFKAPEKQEIRSGNEEVDKAIKTAVAQEKEELQERINFLHHHFEHQLTAMHGQVGATLRKLQEQEERSMERISRIERDMKKKMEDQLETSIEERVRSLENTVSNNMQKTFDDQIRPTIDQHIDSRQGGWIIPFLLLTATVAGIAVWGWKAYTKMTKAHLP